MADFDAPLRIGALLAGFQRPWFVCGGWAIDLYLNRNTRSHKDVDVAIFRQDQLALQAYLRERGWLLDQAVDGQLLPWRDGDFLKLPVHVIWCRNPGSTPDFLEILLNETDGERFLFRRDRSITLALEQLALQAVCGLPLLAPEVVLLYKAGHADLAENNFDFEQSFSQLPPQRRAWLHSALEKLYPQHVWLAHIRADEPNTA